MAPRNVRFWGRLIVLFLGGKGSYSANYRPHWRPIRAVASHVGEAPCMRSLAIDRLPGHSHGSAIANQPHTIVLKTRREGVHSNVPRPHLILLGLNRAKISESRMIRNLKAIPTTIRSAGL